VKGLNNSFPVHPTLMTTLNSSVRVYPGIQILHLVKVFMDLIGLCRARR